MRTPTLRAIAAAALVLCGCYVSHGREPRAGLDAGPPRPDASAVDASSRDAGPRVDAGARGGGYWTLELADDTQVAIPHEIGCTQYADGRVAVRVVSGIDSECELAGPVEASVSSDGTWVVRAFLWVRHPAEGEECVPTTAIAERTLVLSANEGRFVAQTLDGSSRVEYDVSAIDDAPCPFARGRGEACLFDCECTTGLVCIPELGDFVMCAGGSCGDPCDPQASSSRPLYGRHLECDSSEVCRVSGGAAAPSCQPIGGDGCVPGGAECGPGLVCPLTGEASECIWDIRVTMSDRHACARDSDCGEGLYCVEDRASGERRCEVMCLTNEMTCPLLHACEEGTWICEFIGE